MEGIKNLYFTSPPPPFINYIIFIIIILETEIFSEALEENHGIYGFHYRGNPGKVCCKGFLRLKEREEIQRDLDLKNNKKGEWMISQRINGVKALVNNKYLANCWICEGW